MENNISNPAPKQVKRRFEYKLTLGKDINGKLLRKSFYSTKSKADAKRKGEKYRAQYELDLLCGGESLRPKTTFQDWAIQCLQLYKKPFVAGNTFSGTYLAPVKAHLIPYFGKMPLDEIRPIQIQNFVNKQAKEYAPETVKKDFTILAFILQHAMENGLCSANPANSSIRLPKVERANKSAYTQEEYNLVYAFAKEHPDGLAIMLMLETGISRSELLGLRWDDIDTQNQTLHIRQGLVAYQDLGEGSWVMEASNLKNAYRRRDIPLMDPELIQRLKNKPRTIHVCLKKGAEVTEVHPDYVFHSPEGRPFQPNNWSNRVYFPFMNDLQKKYPNLPRLTPHELRHTRSTLWLAQGIPPLMVARLLGHADTKMLSRTYDHTSVETLRDLLKKAQDD